MCHSLAVNDYVFFTISVTLTFDLFQWFSTMQASYPSANSISSFVTIGPITKLQCDIGLRTHRYTHIQTNTTITITSICEINVVFIFLPGILSARIRVDFQIDILSLSLGNSYSVTSSRPIWIAVIMSPVLFTASINRITPYLKHIMT